MTIMVLQTQTTDDIKTYVSRHEKTCLREFMTRLGSHRPGQQQRPARFLIKKLEILYYLGS